MRVCASCGKENPEEARFCLACGTPIIGERAHREVRKTVTILFADVTGSTALGERLDPESLRRVMSRYFDEMRLVIERHGGTVEKFIGDAVMAVFGIPTLHEDDALRAVRAAAEMREALDSLNQELERDRGVAIAVRTGVNTGEVVAGDPSAGQSMVIGDAVNVAARFEQAAAPGEVLLGEATYRLVRDAVEVQPVQPLPLKGKTEPIPAYRLLGVTPGAAGTARRMDSPMIGRNRERSLLHQAFERATSERACHLFTVLGSPGVGKTRLVSEFLGQAREWARVLSGRCLPYGEGITFWPVIEVIREAAGITEGDTPEQARSRLAALCTGEEQALLVTELVGQVLGLSEAAAPAEETFWAIRKLLEALARRQPLVVEFDDIHWGEPTFLDLVEHIADWTRDAPILLLCLARPDLLDRRPGWGGGKMNATSILLEPLSDAECERLMANLLGQAGLAETVRDRITEAAEGNPLFVEEMLSMLIDDGLLQRSDGHWEAVADLSQVSVPPNIRALITARLDRLGREERAVIERASVEGRVFHRGAVAELSPELDRTEAPRHLMALVRKELIRPDRAEFPGEDAFRFRHMLIRDAAYDSLPKEARAELHERFAEWMERAAGHRAVEYEEIIGYHLERAFRYKSELGPVDDRGRALADRAAARLVAAGRRAQARGDVGAMANLYERAASLMRPDSPGRVALLPDLGVALAATGEFSRADQILEEAAAGGDALGDRGLATRARLERSFLLIHTGSDPELWGQPILDEIEGAIEVFEELGDQEGLARAAPMRTAVLFWTGRAALAKEALERSLHIARRSGDAQALGESVARAGTISVYGPMPVEEALRWGEDLYDLVRGRAAEMGFLESRGTLLGMLGRFDEGRRLLDQAEAVGRDHGMRVMMAANHPAAELELAAGNYQGLLDRVEPGLDQLRAMGEKGFLSTSAAYVAEGLYGLGRYDEAEALSRESEEASAPEDIASQVAWRSVRAKVLARRETFDEADRLSQQAVEIASDTDHLIVIAAALMARVEVLRLAARAKDAIPEVERALDLYERKGHLVGARRARGLLEELTSGPPGG